MGGAGWLIFGEIQSMCRSNNGEVGIIHRKAMVVIYLCSHLRTHPAADALEVIISVLYL